MAVLNLFCSSLRFPPSDPVDPVVFAFPQPVDQTFPKPLPQEGSRRSRFKTPLLLDHHHPANSDWFPPASSISTMSLSLS